MLGVPGHHPPLPRPRDHHHGPGARGQPRGRPGLHLLSAGDHRGDHKQRRGPGQRPRDQSLHPRGVAMMAMCAYCLSQVLAFSHNHQIVLSLLMRIMTDGDHLQDLSSFLHSVAASS